jgi:hypothetical protein
VKEKMIPERLQLRHERKAVEVEHLGRGRRTGGSSVARV